MASLLTRLPLALPLACLLTLAGCASNHGGTHAQQKMTAVLASADEAAKAYDSGDMAKAASLYDLVVKSMPDDAETWFRLGNARYRLQQPDEAVVAYQHALQLNPTHARAWHNLGVIRLKQAQAAMTASSQAASDNDPLRASSAETAERIAGIDRADHQPSPAAAVPAPPASPASPAAGPSPAGTVTMPADTSAEASPHRSATVTVIPLGSKSP